MNAGRLSTNAVAIALAAYLFAGSAGSASAGPLLCEDVASHASKDTACESIKNKDDWNSISIKLKSHGKELDKHPFKASHPFEWSSDWSFGSVYVHDGKWAQAQFHDGQPNRNVPEPGALALLGIGLIGMALSSRSRRP